MRQPTSRTYASWIPTIFALLVSVALIGRWVLTMEGPMRVASVVLLGALVLLSGCETESQAPSAAAKALDDLQAKYDELLRDKVDVPVDWAAEDLENIGDWEYRVEKIAYTSPEDFAAQVVRLYRNEALWNRVSEAGMENVRRYFSVETALRGLRGLLDSLA